MRSKSKLHPGKVIHLFSEIQNHLHNGTISHELNQIAKSTRDKEILEICTRAADCLEIEIDTKFYKVNIEQHSHSLQTLVTCQGASTFGRNTQIASKPLR